MRRGERVEGKEDGFWEGGKEGGRDGRGREGRKKRNDGSIILV